MNSSGESAAREQSLSDIARDYLLERDYEMFLSSHVGMSGKLLCDTMEAYAREQTAAKDAEAETFRCQLRDALKLHPNVTWFGAGLLTAASAVVAERDSLREANARLAADLDAALKAGKE